MGGCASKPKEFGTPRPEALPTEAVSASPNKTDQQQPKPEAAATTTATTNEEPPLVDLSNPKEEEEEEEGEKINVPAEAVVPAAVAEAKVAATERPKEIDQADVTAKQLAELNVVEAVKESQEIKPEAKGEKPAAVVVAAPAEAKPKAEEKVKEPKAVAAAKVEEPKAVATAKIEEPKAVAATAKVEEEELKAVAAAKVEEPKAAAAPTSEDKPKDAPLITV